MIRHLARIALVIAVLVPPALAQESPPVPQPGPEHARLKTLEGTWDAKMIMPGSTETIPAVATYKSECGGLWLASDFRCDSPAFKFHGKGLDGYDTAKKKYVGVWVDSMSTGFLTMEGTHDEKTKTSTMIGQGPNEQGKLVKMKNVTKMIDDDHHTFQMYMIGDDGKETLAFTIEYTRRKR
jgi:hypothetical protein